MATKWPTKKIHGKVHSVTPTGLYEHQDVVFGVIEAESTKAYKIGNFWIAKSIITSLTDVVRYQSLHPDRQHMAPMANREMAKWYAGKKVVLAVLKFAILLEDGDGYIPDTCAHFLVETAEGDVFYHAGFGSWEKPGEHNFGMDSTAPVLDTIKIN